MPLSAAQRRELAAQGNRPKSAISIAPGELGPSVIEHIRRAFAERELLKVRVATDERTDTASVAEQLAAEVPCEVVQRVGRVLLLYRERAETQNAE